MYQGRAQLNEGANVRQMMHSDKHAQLMELRKIHSHLKAELLKAKLLKSQAMLETVKDKGGIIAIPDRNTLPVTVWLAEHPWVAVLMGAVLGAGLVIGMMAK